MIKQQTIRFNDCINEKLYEKIKEKCILRCRRYSNINYQDVLSKINENLVNKNPEINNETEFINGWLHKTIRFTLLELSREQKFSQVVPDLREDEKEENELNSKIEEKIVKKLKNTKYWDFYYDKFVLKMNREEIKKKYKLTNGGISSKISNMKRVIRGEHKTSGYNGIAQILDGKIVKAHPDYNSAIRDGFSREFVSKCCRGKQKYYKSFEWKFIKDLHEESKNA